MKRTPLGRGKPLSRGDKPLQRRTPMPRGDGLAAGKPPARSTPERTASPPPRAPVRAKRATPRRRDAPRWTAQEWDAAMPVLLARARDRCECGCGELLRDRCERAHRARRRDGGDRLCNVLLLLPEHHAWAHAHPDEARERGVIIPPTADPAAWPLVLRDGRRVLLTDDPAAPIVPTDTPGPACA